MRESVRRYMPEFNQKFEGRVPFMYLDVKGLVTTADGYLCDPIQYALPLPWLRTDGSEAELSEVTQQFNVIKSGTYLAKAGHTGVPKWLEVNKMPMLHLSTEGMDNLVRKKMEQNEYVLMSRFKEYLEWPADAQLFLHSMSWACGPHFRFPLLEAHLKAGNFLHAVDECTMKEAGNPGLIPRNKANRTLLRNAAVVVTSSLDRERLWYPGLADPDHEVVVTDNPNSELVLGSGPTIHVQEYPPYTWATSREYPQ